MFSGLIYLIHFITHACDLSCPFCCDRDNRRAGAGELSALDIARIYRKLPPLAQITLTGGEPTLRSDLPAILRAALSARTLAVSLNSNGRRPAAIEAALREGLEGAPTTPLKVNLSLDGFEATHDAGRGRGSFEKVCETYDRLVELAQVYPQLHLRMNTVVMDGNVAEMEAFQRFVLRRFPRLFDHVITLQRAGVGAAVDAGVVAGYREAATRARVLREAREGRSHSLPVLAQLHDQMYQRISDVALGKPTPFTCGAGRLFVEVKADGGVYLCENLPPEQASLGRLEDFGWDLGALLKGERAEQARRWVLATGCRCTFECAHVVAPFTSARTLAVAATRAALAAGGRS